MAVILRVAAVASVMALFTPCLALAQQAGSAAAGSPPTPTASSPAPSGGAASGRSARGGETPVERHEDEKMKKETTICKGC